MPGKMSQKEYVEGGGKCPACESDNVQQSRYPLASDDGISFYTHCNECNSSWYERMRVVGYDSLNSGLDFMAETRDEITCCECGVSLSVPYGVARKFVPPSLVESNDTCAYALMYAVGKLSWTKRNGKVLCPICSALPANTSRVAG